MPTKAVKKEEKAEVKAPAKKGKYFYAHGKRKSSIARIRLYNGTGEIIINDKPASEYVAVKALISGTIKAPFKLTGTDKKYDVTVVVTGGGVTSQAEAMRHAISKALIETDPLLKPTLKKAGLLTRDSRVKERKKFGLKRARKGPQFSKR